MNSTDERGEDIGMDRKRKTRKKRWIIGGTIAVVLTVLVSLYAMRSKETAYKTVKAEIGDITTYYAFSGNVAAKNRQMLLSEQMMQIAEILVEKGDRVKTGDVLIKTTAGEELKAGIDGEVTKIYKEENEQIMPGEQLVEIVDYDHLEIVFRADEYDVDALEPGKDAVAEISAIGKVIRGTINDVSREGQIVNGVTFFTATMDIARDDRIRIGMSAEVRLLSKKAENVVKLPMDVIVFDDKNLPYVLKIGSKNSIVEEKITTGISDGTYVEVKSGVSAGEEIVYEQDGNFERFFFPDGGKNVYLGGLRK